MNAARAARDEYGLVSGTTPILRLAAKVQAAHLQFPTRRLNTTCRPKSRLRDTDARLAWHLMSSLRDLLAPTDTFPRRHHGDNAAETAEMLALLGYSSLDTLANAAVPPQIRRGALNLPPAAAENAALSELRGISVENKVFRSFIGQGYYDTFTPPVIQRNILENP